LTLKIRLSSIFIQKGAKIKNIIFLHFMGNIIKEHWHFRLKTIKEYQNKYLGGNMGVTISIQQNKAQIQFH